LTSHYKYDMGDACSIPHLRWYVQQWDDMTRCENKEADRNVDIDCVTETAARATEKEDLSIEVEKHRDDDEVIEDETSSLSDASEEATIGQDYINKEEFGEEDTSESVQEKVEVNEIVEQCKDNGDAFETGKKQEVDLIALDSTLKVSDMPGNYVSLDSGEEALSCSKILSESIVNETSTAFAGAVGNYVLETTSNCNEKPKSGKGLRPKNSDVSNCNLLQYSSRPGRFRIQTGKSKTTPSTG
jgi:hypothetical protein